MPAYFELLRNLTHFAFALKAENGKLILTSESYSTKVEALCDIALVKEYALKRACYRLTNDWPYYFTIMDIDGRNICTSDSFSSCMGRDAATVWVKKNVPGATVVDHAWSINYKNSI